MIVEREEGKLINYQGVPPTYEYVTYKPECYNYIIAITKLPVYKEAWKMV